MENRKKIIGLLGAIVILVSVAVILYVVRKQSGEKDSGRSVVEEQGISSEDMKGSDEIVNPAVSAEPSGQEPNSSGEEHNIEGSDEIISPKEVTAENVAEPGTIKGVDEIIEPIF